MVSDGNGEQDVGLGWRKGQWSPWQVESSSAIKAISSMNLTVTATDCKEDYIRYKNYLSYTRLAVEATPLSCVGSAVTARPNLI